MANDRLVTLLTRFLQQNYTDFNNNEFFSLLSLILLLEISDIFKAGQKKLTEQNQAQTTNNSQNLPNIGNLAGLMSQLQGKGNGGNMQQMLPMLLGALGNNPNLDLGSLLQNLPKGNSGPKDAAEEDTVKNNNDNDEGFNEKKKTG